MSIVNVRYCLALGNINMVVYHLNDDMVVCFQPSFEMTANVSPNDVGLYSGQRCFAVTQITTILYFFNAAG